MAAGKHASVVDDLVLTSTASPGDLPGGLGSCGAAAFVRKEDLGPSTLRRLWSEYGCRPTGTDGRRRPDSVSAARLSGNGQAAADPRPDPGVDSTERAPPSAARLRGQGGRSSTTAGFSRIEAMHGAVRIVRARVGGGRGG